MHVSFSASSPFCLFSQTGEVKEKTKEISVAGGGDGVDGMGTPGEGLGRCSHALIRGVPESLASGEGAGAGLPALDLAKAQREHGVLGGKLRQRLGLQLLELPPEESLPLGPLLGDTAVIQGDTALITRPWSPARRPEVRGVGIKGKEELDLRGFTNCGWECLCPAPSFLP